MTFKERLPYFLGGLTVGIIIVVFIWGKKNTTFDYGPNARVLKNLRIKERVFSEEVLSTLQTHQLDTAIVSKIFKNGDVALGDKIKLETPCFYQYNVQGTDSLENIILTVRNCETNVYIDKLIID